MRIGFVGIGKMGSRMVEKLASQSNDVLVWNRSAESVTKLKDALDKKNLGGRLVSAQSIEDLVNNLSAPRIIWTMLPADPTQEVLEQLAKYIEKGDVLIDGGNSHYTLTQKRYEQFETIGIKFLGVGVSGGLIAAEAGYPLMVGGNKEGYEQIKPILDDLAFPNGAHAYFGEGGAGHFVKMVHNGIEYGIMQAIGEGFGVLEKSPYSFDLLSVSKIWQKGTIISGFLMDRVTDILTNDPTLSSLIGVIAASGEGEWTIEQAKKEKVLVPVIEASFSFRQKSLQDKTIQSSFPAKMVASLRNAFGGHDVQK